MVDDQLNVPLVDAELLEEVELTTNLIIAASEAEPDGALPQSAIDRLLGLDDVRSGVIPYQDVRRPA
jgi:hypothetical protein